MDYPSNDVRLSVVTAFFSPPPPRISRTRPGQADNTLEWGRLRMAQGKALSLGVESDRGVDVEKAWVESNESNGLWWLWESVPFEQIRGRAQVVQPGSGGGEGPPVTPPGGEQGSLGPLPHPDTLLAREVGLL